MWRISTCLIAFAMTLTGYRLFTVKVFIQSIRIFQCSIPVPFLWSLSHMLNIKEERAFTWTVPLLLHFLPNDNKVPDCNISRINSSLKIASILIDATIGPLSQLFAKYLTSFVNKKHICLKECTLLNKLIDETIWINTWEDTRQSLNSNWWDLDPSLPNFVDSPKIPQINLKF